MAFQERLRQPYYSNSIWCHWSYYKLLSPSANSSGGRGLLKSMCDGQKRHKRKRIGFILGFLCLQTSAKHRQSLKNLLSCEKYFGKRSAASQGSVAHPRTRVRSQRERAIFLQLLHFLLLATPSHTGGEKKLKDKKRHGEDADDDTDSDVHPAMRSKLSPARPRLFTEAAALPFGSGRRRRVHARLAGS